MDENVLNIRRRRHFHRHAMQLRSYQYLIDTFVNVRWRSKCESELKTH